MSVWVNIDITEKLYTIHSDGCAYIHELETERKGIEELRVDGGWFNYNSLSEAQVVHAQQFATKYKLRHCSHCQ